MRVGFSAVCAAVVCGALAAFNSNAQDSRGPDGAEMAAAKPGRETGAPTEPEPKRTVEDVQRCLTDAGYYDGPLNGKMTSETLTAFWFFKHEHGLKAYSDPFALDVAEKLFSLCPRDEEIEQETELEPQVPSAAPEAEVDPSPAPTFPRAEPVDCLFDDLAQLLREAHGREPEAPDCATQCLPAPEGVGAPALDVMAQQYGFEWCRSCIDLSTPLSLHDILKIERVAGVSICAQPLGLANEHGTAHPISNTPRTLWRGQPPGTGNENAIAVVIGNGAPRDTHNGTRSARADADAMVSLLAEHLGYSQDNLIELRGATRADFERVFGEIDIDDGENEKGQLARLVEANPGSSVTIYYSGRAGLAAETGDAFLVPTDTAPFREAETGVALSLIYERLSALPAGSVLLLVEASFAGNLTGPILSPNAPLLDSRVLPESGNPLLSVMTAATGDQRTLIDPVYGIGLFTRYVVEGLAGNADIEPIGNGDRQVDVPELYSYVAQMTRRAAARSYGFLQRPALSLQAGTAVLGAVESPAR